MTNIPDDRIGDEILFAIKIDGDAVRGHLDELVRSTVEETLNKLLDAEAYETALYHTLGALPEPKFSHEFN